ncbi:MAG TPA: hypothetical protein VK059_11685 [Nocardioidaceae bacterium]|nr:hypothetical protein [Nocardioidaceae bacterium]
MHTGRLTIAAIAATSLALTGMSVVGAASAGAEDSARAGVCVGVKRCHRVATIDVNGDRRADQVGWQQLNRKQVRIRVRIAGGPVVMRKVYVGLWWPGGQWGDAAWIDGRRGAELLIGSVMGAHTPYYTMLTYRRGRLVVEKSPATGAYGSNRWAIDSSLAGYAGWNRHVGKRGRVTITQRIAFPNRAGKRYSGHDVRYVWRNGDWKRTKRVRRTYPNANRAARIAGWHVGHLQRFPGR